MMFFSRRRKAKKEVEKKATSTLDQLRAELKDKVVDTQEQDKLKGGQQVLINPLDNWNDSTDMIPQ